MVGQSRGLTGAIEGADAEADAEADERTDDEQLRTVCMYRSLVSVAFRGLWRTVHVSDH